MAACDRVATPVLVGIMRPLILLPAVAMGGWVPEQIEMVLLHELAHVRRWDNLVNLLQRLIESLHFFHPAVWIVSGWIRQEREHCCDRIVVAHTGKAHVYAEMLLALASAPAPLHGDFGGSRPVPQTPGQTDSPNSNTPGGPSHEALTEPHSHRGRRHPGTGRLGSRPMPGLSGRRTLKQVRTPPRRLPRHHAKPKKSNTKMRKPSSRR